MRPESISGVDHLLMRAGTLSIRRLTATASSASSATSTSRIRPRAKSSSAPKIPGVAPVNSWFGIFGQFLDHGLDLIGKGGQGTTIRIALAAGRSTLRRHRPRWPAGDLDHHQPRDGRYDAGWHRAVRQPHLAPHRSKPDLWLGRSDHAAAAQVGLDRRRRELSRRPRTLTMASSSRRLGPANGPTARQPKSRTRCRLSPNCATTCSTRAATH